MKLIVAASIALAVQAAACAQAAPKLSLTLEREQGVNSSDHGVRAAVRVTNLSQQNIVVGFAADADSEYTFAVIGPDGGPAPPTKDVERLRRSPRSSGSRKTETLAPGQSEAWGSSLLSDLLDFSKPGTYRITATRHFAPPIDETDSSNVLEVKVP